MADAKALFTQRFDAARAAWTQGDEPAAAESFHSAVIAARSDPSLRRELASALFNLGKLSRRFGPAGEAAAEGFLTEALAISEELFGDEDAGLASVLHELSRVHLQRSHHARAEDVLERLLEIARVKGEEHPDVASALSDLAFVKHKLGDDASAEALYRDALRIREKVLEPNHVSTVGTLERLSETCAVRGNFAEALALLHRAIPAREAALGAGHERVRAARTRVAQLELQMGIATDTTAASRASRDAEATPAWLKRVPDSRVDTTSTHAPSPIHSKELEFLGESEPRVLPARKKPTVRASAGVAAVVVVMAGLLILRPRAGSGRHPGSTNMTAAGDLAVTAPATGTASIGTRGAHADSLRVASATPAPTAKVMQRQQRASQSARPELRLPVVEVHLDSIVIPDMPAARSVDSVWRSAMERQRASDTDRTETREPFSRPASADVDVTSPRIIEPAPDLAFPAGLLRAGRREGVVVVRFMVNERGRVNVASMIVERSDHELFTAAVRDVLRRFRFEPARTLGPESKPVAAWVSLPFRFTTNK